jgi:molybdenum cofactor synthesis domain-containing protein
LSVGTELLLGKVANTNATWLCDRIARLGGFTRRVTVVPDVLDDIVEAIQEALGRKTPWVLITGGLGPTYDDRTLEALARALGLRLQVNDKARGWLQERLARRGAELTPERLKMVTLPEGATPLRNPVGAAPGVLMMVDECRLVALPGVPEEMEAIFLGAVEPRIKEWLDVKGFVEGRLRVRGVHEASLAGLVEEVARLYPEFYVKSHPRGLVGGVPVIEIYVSGSGKETAELERGLHEILERLRSGLAAKGGVVEDG